MCHLWWFFPVLPSPSPHLAHLFLFYSETGSHHVVSNSRFFCFFCTTFCHCDHSTWHRQLMGRMVCFGSRLQRIHSVVILFGSAYLGSHGVGQGKAAYIVVGREAEWGWGRLTAEAQLLCSFYSFSLFIPSGPQIHRWCCPHLRRVLLSQLILSANTLQTYTHPELCSPCLMWEPSMTLRYAVCATMTFFAT